jgi:hypothetical protein
MTDPNRTAISLLVDRSGSMRKIKEAAEDSVNEFVRAQAAAAGRVTIRIVQFDSSDHWGVGLGEGEDWYLVSCPSTPAGDVPEFTLEPRGRTALYDAMVKSLDEFGAELAALPENERPGTVVFAVYTDGLENASTHTSLDVRERVEHQIGVYGWHVVYLGANQDAILEGAKMGVPQASSMTYDATADGVRSAGASFESIVASASAGGPAEFTDEDRKRASKTARKPRKS